MKSIYSILVSLLVMAATAGAQTISVPNLISYQGRVVDAGGIPVGDDTPVNRTVIFRIWDHPSDVLTANLIYSESQVVTISNGEFSALVGQGVSNLTTTFNFDEVSKKLDDLSTAFSGPNRYLGVTVATGAIIDETDKEITPRQQIVATPFAMRADVAGSVDNLAITSANIANKTIDAGNIKDNSITALNIAANGVGSSEIADNSVTGSDIATDTITAVDIAAGAVGTSEIANGSVTGSDIATDTITAVDIATGGVGSSEILNGSVNGDKILNGSVTSADLGRGTVATTGKSRILHIRLAADGTILSSSPGMGLSFGGPYNVNTFRVTYPTFSVAPTVVAMMHVLPSNIWANNTSTISKVGTSFCDILTFEKGVIKPVPLSVMIIGEY